MTQELEVNAFGAYLILENTIARDEPNEEFKFDFESESLENEELKVDDFERIKDKIKKDLI